MNKDISSESVDLQSINRKLDQIISFLSGFKAQAPVMSAVRPPKFPLPTGTNWQDIVIKLSDSYALISVRNAMPKPRKVNFVELDCYDKLRKSRLNPDRHWKLLQRLAEHDGELPWRKGGRIKHRWSPDGDEDDSESTEMIGKSSIIHTDKYSAKEISRTKKSIYGLRQRLKAFFGLAEDPFHPYSEAHTYKTKFQLRAYNPDEWKDGMDDLPAPSGARQSGLPDEDDAEENKDEDDKKTS